MKMMGQYEDCSRNHCFEEKKVNLFHFLKSITIFIVISNSNYFIEKYYTEIVTFSS